MSTSLDRLQNIHDTSDRLWLDQGTKAFPHHVWVIPLVMWPEFVFVSGSLVALRPKTEPTFR